MVAVTVDLYRRAVSGKERQMTDVGSPAVDFALEDTARTIHRLEHYRGYWLLMVFHRHLG